MFYLFLSWQEEDEKRAAKALESLLDDFSNPEIADSLEKAFRHLGGHVEGEEALKEGIQAAKAAEKEEAVRLKYFTSGQMVTLILISNLQRRLRRRKR